MSKVKAGGSSKNIYNNAGQRLVKRFGGQAVNEGEVLVRQTGFFKLAGEYLHEPKLRFMLQKAGASFQKVQETTFHR